MNTKIMSRILSIAVVLLGVSAGTVAYFSDTGTSTGNVFASGSLDLNLSNDDETFTDNVIASFGGTNLAPGDCLDPATLYLQNTGSVAGNHVDLSATNTDSTFASYLKLNTFTFDGGSLPITDSNTNGFRDLEDLATNGVVDLAMTDFVSHLLVAEVCLDISTPNSQQSASDTLDLTVLLDQGPHL